MGCHFLFQGSLPDPGLNQSLFLLLHWLAESLSLHHLEAPIWYRFPECGFAEVKTPHQMEDVNYLMTKSTQLQASWSLRTDNVHPCDCPAASPSASLRIVHKLITNPVTPTPSLSWFLKVLCQNRSSRLLRTWTTYLSAAWPCSKPFSAPNTKVSVCLVSLCIRQTNVNTDTFLKKVFIEFVTTLLLFYVLFFFFGHEACEILAPQPGIELPCNGRRSPNQPTSLDHQGSPLVSDSSLQNLKEKIFCCLKPHSLWSFLRQS